MATSKYFRVKQVRSDAGRLPEHRRTIAGLGLRPGRTVDLPDTPQVRGMIYAVHYLLEVTPVNGKLEKKANPKRQKRREAKKHAAKKAA